MWGKKKLKLERLFYGVDFFLHNYHIHTANHDIIKGFYSPTNAQVIVLKTILKFTSNSSDMFRCSHTILREHIICAC